MRGITTSFTPAKVASPTTRRWLGIWNRAPVTSRKPKKTRIRKDKDKDKDREKDKDKLKT